MRFLYCIFVLAGIILSSFRLAGAEELQAVSHFSDGSGLPESLHVVASSGENLTENEVCVSVDVLHPGHVISPLMNGSHFVYGSEPDQLYQNPDILEWMRSAKTGIIRWPGGTAVMSYHWDDLTGDNFGPDRWDTANYVEQHIPASNYMDLDEFIAYCRKVGAMPMVGVNIRSGKFYRTDQDGLDEARRLIRYCVDQGYDVRHWYIGNEGYAKGFSPESYARYIDMYAAELKKADPDILIIGDWKFGPEDKGRYDQMLTIVRNSSQLDIMEIHEKWGNDWGIVSGTALADWKNEFPVYNGKIDYYCKKFYADVKAMGKQTRLGMNEWGIGAMADGNAYDYALLAADMMIQMFMNDLYSACYWNLNISSGDGRKSRVFTVRNGGTELEGFNPVSRVFNQYAFVLGNEYLGLVSDNRQVYGLASVNMTADTVQLLILNKSSLSSRLSISLPGFEKKGRMAIDWFDEGGNAGIDTIPDGAQTVLLPAYSFSRIQITGRAVNSGSIGKTAGSEMKLRKSGNSVRIVLPGDDSVLGIVLTDMGGRTLLSEKPPEWQPEISVSQMQKGIYLLRVEGYKRIYVEKIMI